MCGKTHRLGNECLCGKNRHRFLETEGIAYPAGLGGGHMEKLQNWSVGRRYGRNHGQEPLLWFPWAGTIEAVQAGLWHPTPVFLPGNSHGQRSLVGCSPRGCKESDTTKRLHFHFQPVFRGLPRWLSGKESTCQCRRRRFNPWVRKIPWRRKWQPTPVFLPGKSHGQSSLAGYSPRGHKESDMTQ